MENNNQFEQQQNYEYTPVVENATPANTKDTLGVISLICGICSIVLSCCCPTLFGIVGIILACVSKSKTGGVMTGKAKTGLILSIIGIVLGIVGSIVLIATGMLGNIMGSTGGGYYY